MLSNTNTFCKQLKTYLFTSAYTRWRLEMRYWSL